MYHEEIEVKFIVDDLLATRQRVLDMGAQLKTPRTYEHNVLFDTAEHRLQKQDLLLRLRRDRRHILTCKEPPPVADADYKVLNEYEVEVSDPDQMHTILEKLGFLPTMRYEKYRETFCYQDAEILLDETPVGTFVEIEASRTAIGDIATRLGLDFETRLTSGYQDIFRAVCATYNFQLTDMTFDNFQTQPIDLRACNLT